jgi:hypothetical protein
MTGRKKLRASRIVIDLPTEMAPVWATVDWQRVFKDANYQTTQTVDLAHRQSRGLATFAADIRSIIDPVTGQTVTASGAGAAALIKKFVQAWLLAERPDLNINEHGDIEEPAHG